MRIHLVSLPHTQTKKAYSTCAYTEKVRKFSTMMTKRGHDIFLYAGEENEAECREHICCITKEKQAEYGFNGPEDYLKIDFNSSEPWGYFHSNVIEEIKKRIEPKDIICVITGIPTMCFESEFPNNIVVEFGVGYSGICHKYRVFESYAWRNFVYGQKNMDGVFFDEVIPNYFETKDFPFIKKKGDYFLYIGRLTEKKGYRIAQDVCERKGYRLLVAGPGEFDGYGEYIGILDPRQRAKVMGHARAVFVPTLYVAPFEGVHVEAMLCGTPVITTDFGVFSESVYDGINGFRCNMFEEFYMATEMVKDLDYLRIRKLAIERYSTETVAVQYDHYFNRLLKLYGGGWYGDYGNIQSFREEIKALENNS